MSRNNSNKQDSHHVRQLAVSVVRRAPMDASNFLTTATNVLSMGLLLSLATILVLQSKC